MRFKATLSSYTTPRDEGPSFPANLAKSLTVETVSNLDLKVQESSESALDQIENNNDHGNPAGPGPRD